MGVKFIVHLLRDHDRGHDVKGRNSGRSIVNYRKNVVVDKEREEGIAGKDNEENELVVSCFGLILGKIG